MGNIPPIIYIASYLVIGYAIWKFVSWAFGEKESKEKKIYKPQKQIRNEWEEDNRQL